MVEAVLLACRAMREWDVVVGNIVEKVEFFLLQHQACSNRVHRRIAPAFIEEATSVVERCEEVDVGVRSKPIEVSDFEVGPEMAVVVGRAIVVTQKGHRVALDNVLGVVLGEILCRIPEGRDGLDVFVQAEGKAVLLLVIGHELESIVVDIAVQLDAGLDAPVPFVVEHQWVAEEEARLVAAHVPVADGITVDDFLLLHFITNSGSLLLVNPLGEGPMLFGNLAIFCSSRHERGCNLFELVVEIIVVQENPVVVELAVEAVFNVANRLGNLPDILVTCEGDKGSVHALALGGGRREFLVIGRG